MKHSLIGAASCAVLLALAASPALAQSDPSPAPTEIGHVVTSDRQDEPSTATARTTYIITKDEMIRRGALTIADAIAAIPGVSIARYGAQGAYSEAFIRGASPGQTLILMDGRPIGGAQTGTVDLGQIPTNGIERIEIVEGGGSTLYGSGAVGGVINLITKPQSAKTRVTIGGGSLGSKDVTVEAPFFTFERHLAINAFSYPAIGPTPAGDRSNQDVAATNASLRFPFKLGTLDAYANAGLRQQQLGVMGPVGFESLTTRQNTTDGEALFGLARTTASSTTSLELSGTRSTLLYYSDPADPNGCACNDYNSEARVQASLRTAVQSDRSRFVGGFDLAHGVARIDSGFGAPAIQGFAQTAVYAQESLLVGASRIYAGLRAERDGGYGGAITPAFGAIVPVGQDLSLRANYTTAFHAPTILDLYYPGFSNPNLLPERTNGGDVTLQSSAILGGASVGWFFSNGTDLIESDPTFTTLINVQKVSFGGFTAEVHTKPVSGVRATVGVTDLYRALDLTAVATRLPRRTVFTVNGALEYLPAGRPSFVDAAGLIARSVGQRDTAGSAPAYTSIDAYARLRVAPRALLSLRAFNLGGERYAEVAGYPAPGRTFTVDLSTR